MAHPNFVAQHPRCFALELDTVKTGQSDHPGFDQEHVRARLGTVRFAALLKQIVDSGSTVFVCNHRTYGTDEQRDEYKDEHGNPINLEGYEVPCIWAKDLEAFLEKEA